MTLNFPNSPTDGQIYEGYQWDATKGAWVAAGGTQILASTAVAGIVELATDAETQTGTDTTRAVTPASLSSRTATETRTGLVELATDAEVTTGTDTARAVTPAGLVTGLARSGGMRYVDTVYFTSSGTFQKGAYSWLRGIRVIAVGGGGAGGSAGAAASNQHSSGSGGGSGGYAEAFITNISGLASSISVTVGAGGTAVTTATGNSGGTSSFGSLVVAGGGDGGERHASSGLYISPLAGAGGTATAGDLLIPGRPGEQGSGYLTLGRGGAGGSSLLGSGGLGRYTGAGSGNQGGLPGEGYGSGGSGSMTNAGGSAVLGGAGADGIVVVELYA